MIRTLNNILLGLLAVILVIGIFVIYRGADNMSTSLRAFIMGVLAMAFLVNIVVTWLKSQVMKKRREKR